MSKMINFVESDFQSNEFPLNCENCTELGYIFVKELDTPSFIICQKCEGETSQVWCPKCEMGGSFVRGIVRRPNTWSCPNCHTKYSLPSNFYKNPVPLFGIEDLPQAVRERIEHNQVATKPKLTLRSLLLLLIYIVIYLLLFLWPLLFGFWLVMNTGNPFWWFSGLAILLAWLHFGRLIIGSIVAWLSNFAKKFNETQ